MFVTNGVFEFFLVALFLQQLSFFISLVILVFSQPCTGWVLAWPTEWGIVSKEKCVSGGYQSRTGKSLENVLVFSKYIRKSMLQVPGTGVSGNTRTYLCSSIASYLTILLCSRPHKINHKYPRRGRYWYINLSVLSKYSIWLKAYFFHTLLTFFTVKTIFNIWKSH